MFKNILKEVQTATFIKLIQTVVAYETQLVELIVHPYKASSDLRIFRKKPSIMVEQYKTGRQAGGPGGLMTVP